MENKIFDLAVLGAGPGGYVAAIHAAKLGLKTALIEKNLAGGVCLNIGCIPSKSLINSAEIFNNIADLEKTGIEINKNNFSYAKVNEQSRKVSENLSKGVLYLLKKNNISYFQNEGKIKSKNEILLNDGALINAKNLIIATGSRPKELKNFSFDKKYILSSDDFLLLKELPKNILIIGGGVIGCEFAYIANSFGSDVTIIEALPEILANEDKESVDVLLRTFRKKNIKTITDAKTISYEIKNDKVLTKIKTSENEETIESDKVLVVTGRSPNTENIGLENIGLSTENGFIPVKDFYETEVQGVYAIGDIVLTPMLAHVASREGEIAVSHLTGEKCEKKIILDAVPGCIYTDPQIASFGLTEKKALDSGLNFKKSVFPFRALGKAQAVARYEGFVKILYSSENNDIIGAHIVGNNATELIHEILIAKKAKLKPEEISSVIYAHPTMSEGVMEAFLGINDNAIHI